MMLPFTAAQFLDVFGAYNTALWPVVLVLWVATVVVAVRWMTTGLPSRAIWTLLAVHWAIAGIAYHWIFFRRINPVAAIFAGFFVVQAAIFAWLAATSRGRVILDRSLRSIAGAAFVAYGLVYPFIGLAAGLSYPRAPMFAVPCPTTLVTAGVLLASTSTPRWANIIPVLWAFVGASAAFALGIRADLMLVVAGLGLAIATQMPVRR